MPIKIDYHEVMLRVKKDIDYIIGTFEYPIYWICIKNSNKPNITIEVL